MVCNKCVYVCGTIPPVFWYNYPNCAPQGAPQVPQGKCSLCIGFPRDLGATVVTGVPISGVSGAAWPVGGWVVVVAGPAAVVKGEVTGPAAAWSVGGRAVVVAGVVVAAPRRASGPAVAWSLGGWLVAAGAAAAVTGRTAGPVVAWSVGAREVAVVGATAAAPGRAPGPTVAWSVGGLVAVAAGAAAAVIGQAKGLTAAFVSGASGVVPRRGHGGTIQGGVCPRGGGGMAVRQR